MFNFIILDIRSEVSKILPMVSTILLGEEEYIRHLGEVMYIVYIITEAKRYILVVILPCINVRL